MFEITIKAPSGYGKTQLLNALADYFDSTDLGYIAIDDFDDTTTAFKAKVFRESGCEKFAIIKTEEGYGEIAKKVQDFIDTPRLVL